MLKHTVDTSNATPDRELPCAQCPSKFTSKRDLMRHKERAPNHEYCKLHDMDFETWEDHGIHRVNNREHKTCEHCYQDFGSREGLNLHVAQVCLPPISSASLRS